MSRIGKIPVLIPKGVKVNIADRLVHLEGPKGKLDFPLLEGITVENKDEKLIVSRQTDNQQHRANQGTTRAILANIIVGITQGHKANLEIQGVGFRAQVQGKKLILNLGFSHPVDFTIPDGVTVKTPKPTDIEIEGVDNALVGEVAANIRRVKPPEPYKGKGIRYLREAVRRKQGKSVTK